MGVHAINPRLHQAQFGPAKLDPQNPPLLLLDATKTRVIGLEWEAADVGQAPPRAFGQTVPLLPGHPGIPEPHYMLHAYFRPGNRVLFAEFDPLVRCGGMPATSTLPVEDPAENGVAHLVVGLVATGVFMLLLVRPRRTAQVTACGDGAGT